jgi:hypothetical protein
MRVLVSDLLPGTEYSIQVRAKDELGTSEWSPLFQLTTIEDTVPPKVPSNATWVVSGDAFHGEWDAVTENIENDISAVSRYEVELVASGTTRIVSVTQQTGSRPTFDLSFSDNRALFSTPRPSVSFRVRAVDSKDLKSDWTTAIVATNPAPGPPTAPAGAVATGGADAIYLTWGASPDTDVERYNIYVGTTSGFTPSSSNRIFSGNATAFTYTTLTYTEQFFKIRAVDKFLQESTDLTGSATPTSPFGSDTTPPSAPTSFAVDIQDDPAGLLITQRALATWSWNASDTSLAGFHIRYRKSGTTAWTTVVAPPDPQQPYLITTGLEPNVAYDFEIRAFDTSSNESAWVALSTNAEPPAVVPTIFGAIVIEGGGYIESSNYGAGVGFRIDEDSITIHDGNIDGQAISTGIIHSNQPALDADGNPIIGEWAWSIDLEGDAVLGNAMVRGNLVVGAATGGVISVMQSGNYVPGTQGWQLRSDGTGDLISLGANTIHGQSIISNTVSADAIESETVLSGQIYLRGGFQTLGFPIYFQASITQGTNVLTSLSPTFDVSDVGKLIEGEVFIGGTTISSFVSSTQVTTTRNADATSEENAFTLYRGRQITINSEDGISIYSTDGVSKVLSAPTNPGLPVYVDGEFSASALSVRDNFLLQGSENFVSTNSKLYLSSTTSAPPTAPTTTTTYYGTTTWIDGSFSGYATGLVYDSTDGLMKYANLFFGGQQMGYNPSDGSFGGNVDMNATNSGIMPWGGLTKVGTRWFSLVYDANTNEWKVYGYTSGGGMTNKNSEFVYNRRTDLGATLAEWTMTGPISSRLREPAIGTDGTNILIARAAKDGRIWISEYNTSGTHIHTTPTRVVNNEDMVSVGRGSYDFGLGTVYYVATRGGNSGSAINYVFNPVAGGNGRLPEYTTHQWKSPYNVMLIGTAWTGTEWVSLSVNSYNHWRYTTLGYNQTTPTYYFRTSWIDLDTSSISVTNKQLTDNVATLTVGSGHNLNPGNKVNITGVDSTFNGSQVTLTSVTTTTISYDKVAADVASVAASGSVATIAHETALSKVLKANPPKRSVLTVNGPEPPDSGGRDDPSGTRVYASTTESGTYYHQLGAGGAGAYAARLLTDPTYSGTTHGTLPAFDGAVPASIRSTDDALIISADATIKAKDVTITGTLSGPYKRGTTAYTTDANGDITITHGLGKVPAALHITGASHTGSSDTYKSLQSSWTTTQAQVRIFASNVALANSPRTLSWVAIA